MSSSPSTEHSLWRAPPATVGVHSSVRLPGSKSLTNRALILAALADGPSRIRDPLRARDTELMVDALGALGVDIRETVGDWAVRPRPLTGPARIDVGLAGTVMRFVPPIAGLATGQIHFSGDARAESRPMGGMLRALAGLGVAVEPSAAAGLPFSISGNGAVPGGAVTIDASASSQFVSGLLLAGARYQAGVVVRHIGPPLPSASHVAMTVDQLRFRSVAIDSSSPNRWRVEPGPIGGRDVTVEPDLSTAAPFLAAALVTGGSVQVAGWPRATTQPGDHLRRILPALGARVELSDDGLTVEAGGDIPGARLDLRDAGELAPVLTAVCAFASSPSQLSGIAHLRGHESDRLAALATEINGLGGKVSQTSDGLTVVPRALHGGRFRTYADHRLVHAAAVLGLRVDGILVDDVACVAKSHPDFVQAWDALLR